MSGLHLEELRPTWAEIDLDALAHNLRVVRGRLDGPGVLAVVKADAYGHGAVPVARRLEREGVDGLGVALVEEGVEIRRAGVTTPVLVMGGFAPAQADLLLSHDLTAAVFHVAHVEALAAAAARRWSPARVHVKIDTGMGHLGVPAEQLAGFADRLMTTAGVDVEGAFSHLAVAEEPGDPFTSQQIQRFLKAVATLKGRGLRPMLLHLANSAAVIDHRAAWMNLARPGLLLYGYNPVRRGALLPVRPVLALRSRIICLKEVASGSTVGYGRTWRAAGPARIATLAIGYADGLPGAAGNSGSVLIRGSRAPIVGRVSMDQTTVDVTGLPEVDLGDAATVIGADGEDAIGADAVAAAAGTIPWEILARIGARVPRLVHDAGRIALSSRFASQETGRPLE